MLLSEIGIDEYQHNGKKDTADDKAYSEIVKSVFHSIFLPFDVEVVFAAMGKNILFQTNRHSPYFSINKGKFQPPVPK